MMSRFTRILSIALLTAAMVGATTLSATPTGAQTAAPEPVTDVVATPGPHGELDVSWQAPAGGPAADSTNVAILDLDRNPPLWGMPQTCGGCESLSVDHLVPGRRYQVVVNRYARVDGADHYSSNASSAVFVAPVDPACASVTGSCVVVDATAPTDVPADNRFNGLMHGADPAPPAELVDRLSPSHWRVAAQDAEAFDAAAASGAEVTVMIDAAWNRGMGGQTSPWEDWEHYEQYVANVVRWHMGMFESQARVPARFDIMNEPADRSYDPELPITRELVLEQYRRAHDAIRSVAPDAEIVGPSMNRYAMFDPSGLLDLHSFLDFVQQERLRFDAIVWHEIGGGQPKQGLFAGSPTAVTTNVASARSILDARGMDDVDILINEYMSPWGRNQPAYAVGYLAALTGSGADGGNRTCWTDVVDSDLSTCWQPMLDGLLTSDGEPTASYWVHAGYADHTGSVLAASATGSDTSVLASRDGDVVRALLGRHSDESGSVPATVAVRVAPGSTWSVEVTHLPFHPTDPLAEPSPTATVEVEAGDDGLVQVPVDDLAAGDAWTIELALLEGPPIEEPPEEPGGARGTDLACPPGEVPPAGFTDVPRSNVHGEAIDCVAWWGVANGTSADRYDPRRAVNRAQMASFIARLLDEAGVDLAGDPPNAFPDDDRSVHARNIDRLAALGVVAGRGDGTYGPSEPVSRAQMATFLVRAADQAGVALEPGPDAFVDDETSVHEPNIDAASAAGLTGGRGDGTYGPALSVQRAQMASFLVRELDLFIERETVQAP